MSDNLCVSWPAMSLKLAWHILTHASQSCLIIHLSETTYNFCGSGLSEEDVSSALKAEHGPFLLKGRGPGLCAIVSVLSAFTLDFPQDVIIQKWIEDLIAATEHTCTAASEGQASESGQPGLAAKWVCLNLGSKPFQPAPKKTEVQELSGTLTQGSKAVSSVMEHYEDVPKSDPKGPGGRPRTAILDKLAVHTHLCRENKLVYRCIAAPQGCTKTYAAGSYLQALR
ncbi:hypothetical protein C8Q80DRAFT_1275395 [Daedaleopsis nitida]|nr:hypothetical protein C8Q80DRAFT_1275395 [Daedaleopsis nitida]